MIDQIIKKMTREVENCPESSFFGTGIILDVGVKRYFTPSDTELLRALHFRNTKNIRNPLIFLQKMASCSCFWRVPRSQILLQASLHRTPDLLTLVHRFVNNCTNHVGCGFECAGLKTQA